MQEWCCPRFRSHVRYKTSCIYPEHRGEKLTRGGGNAPVTHYFPKGTGNEVLGTWESSSHPISAAHDTTVSLVMFKVVFSVPNSVRYVLMVKMWFLAWPSHSKCFLHTTSAFFGLTNLFGCATYLLPWLRTSLHIWWIVLANSHSWVTFSASDFTSFPWKSQI